MALLGSVCRKSAKRQQRYALLNDIFWRAVRRAGVQAIKDPTGLLREDGKIPPGASLIPWSKGKCLAWDVTVPDTYADAHLTVTSSAAGSVASQPATFKTAKYVSIFSTYHFVPVAIETSGVSQ